MSGGTSTGNFESHDWQLLDGVTDTGIVLHFRQCQQCGLLIPQDVEIREPGEPDGYYTTMDAFPACSKSLTGSQ